MSETTGLIVCFIPESYHNRVVCIQKLDIFSTSWQAAFDQSGPQVLFGSPQRWTRALSLGLLLNILKPLGRFTSWKSPFFFSGNSSNPHLVWSMWSSWRLKSEIMGQHQYETPYKTIYHPYISWWDFPYVFANHNYSPRAMEPPIFNQQSPGCAVLIGVARPGAVVQESRGFGTGFGRGLDPRCCSWSCGFFGWWMDG